VPEILYSYLHEGPPNAPTIIGMQEVGQSTFIISWIEGFHGGYDQDIHTQISSNGQVWTERNTIFVSAKTPTTLRNTTITDIAGTNLFLRLFASNEWGVSKMSDIWNITRQGICFK